MLSRWLYTCNHPKHTYPLRYSHFLAKRMPACPLLMHQVPRRAKSGCKGNGPPQEFVACVRNNGGGGGAAQDDEIVLEKRFLINLALQSTTCAGCIASVRSLLSRPLRYSNIHWRGSGNTFIVCREGGRKDELLCGKCKCGWWILLTSMCDLRPSSSVLSPLPFGQNRFCYLEHLSTFTESRSKRCKNMCLLKADPPYQMLFIYIMV